MELRASEAADILSGSREFWIGLADGACAHLSAQDTNCWNGLKVATYSRPAASVGVSAQKYNPEVQISKPDTTVYALADQLRAVKRLVTKQLTWMPESDSLKRSDATQFEGSGSDPNYKNHDDEDAEDDGMGSGDPPEAVDAIKGTVLKSNEANGSCFVLYLSPLLSLMTIIHVLKRI